MGMPRFIRATTFRIALAFLAAQVVALGVALYTMHVFTQRALYEESRQFVTELNQNLLDSYHDGGADGLVQVIDARVRVLGNHDLVVGLRRGRRIIAGNVQTWPQIDTNPRQWQYLTLTQRGITTPERSIVIATRLAPDLYLVAGETLTERERLTSLSRDAFFGALLLGGLLAVLVSAIAMRLFGRRIDHVATVASVVGSGNFNRRVELHGGGDAFDRLGLAINAMLDRIEALVGELRLVTDSLAHDLRSPVARLRARLDAVVRDTPDPQLATALGAALEDADRLEGMLAMAIQISRAEAGIGRDQFKPFSISDMIHDLAEVYGPLAEESGIDIRVSGPNEVTVFAHRELLGQAIANLIDNALNHAEHASVIELRLSVTGSRVDICVADNGCGIPSDQLSEALRRFGRLDSARGSNGAGLGLSLVSTIAHLHQGTLQLTDNAPGVMACLRLPIRQPANV